MNRSTFDRYMIEKYDNALKDPNVYKKGVGWYQPSGYNTEPFPGSRSQADMDLQKTWGQTCNSTENYCSSMKKKVMENYEPLTGFRTQFDLEQQKKWGQVCSGSTEGYCGYSQSLNCSTMNDPSQNPLSYAPYIPY